MNATVLRLNAVPRASDTISVPFIANDVRALGPAGTTQESCASWTAKIVAPRSCLGELRRTLTREHSLMGSSEGQQPDAWQRFVLLLDDAAQVRWSLRYRPEERLPSPIELASFAKAKRVQVTALKRILKQQPRTQLRIVPTMRP